MDLLWNVSVAVKHERSSVGVGAHIVEDEPIADFSAFEVRVLLITNLVEAIAGRTKDSSRNTLGSSL